MSDFVVSNVQNIWPRVEDFFHLIKLFCFGRNLKLQCTYWRVPEMCLYTGVLWAVLLLDWPIWATPTTWWPLGKWKRRRQHSEGDSVFFFQLFWEELSQLTIQNKYNCSKLHCLTFVLYSWTLVIYTRLFWIPCYFEFKTIYLGFAILPFTISHFKLLPFISPEVSK